MSSGRPDLSEIVDAMTLAARGAELSRQFRLEGLPRLADFAGHADSDATLRARFHLADGRCSVVGDVSATLRLTCQRCLRPIDFAIDDRFHIVLVRSETEMNELPDAQDSVVTDPTRVDLGWLTEEQLLLALPLVPLHANSEDCETTVLAHLNNVPTTGDDMDSQIVSADVTRQTPFANLRELLKKDR